MYIYIETLLNTVKNCFYSKMRINYTIQHDESVAYTSVCCKITIQRSILIFNSISIFEKLEPVHYDVHLLASQALYSKSFNSISINLIHNFY